MPLLLAVQPSYVIPLAASTFGYNTRTFHFAPTDLSRIGTTGSEPTADADFWICNNYGSDTIPSNYLSYDNGRGALKIQKASSLAAFAHNHPTLQSVYAAGGANHGLTPQYGRLFNNGWVTRWVFAFDQTLASGGAGFPALWSSNFWGELDTDGGGKWLEVDHYEAFPGAGNISDAFFLNDWDFRTGGTGQTSTDLPAPNLGITWSDTVFHTVDRVWVPTTKNSGVGLYQVYVDNIHITSQDVTYTLTAPASSPASNYNGCYSVAETAQNPMGFSLYITAGLGASNTDWPLYIKEVSVFQSSNSDMVSI